MNTQTVVTRKKEMVAGDTLNDHFFVIACGENRPVTIKSMRSGGQWLHSTRLPKLVRQCQRGETR